MAAPVWRLFTPSVSTQLAPVVLKTHMAMESAGWRQLYLKHDLAEKHPYKRSYHAGFTILNLGHIGRSWVLLLQYHTSYILP